MLAWAGIFFVACTAPVWVGALVLTYAQLAAAEDIDAC